MTAIDIVRGCVAKARRLLGGAWWNLVRLGVAVALMGAAFGAHAYDVSRAQALAKQHACFGCHAVNRKLVGPSFAQIAGRYKNDAVAPAQLVKKVVQGGAGAWGPVPMPSHPRLSDADARTIVDWVLAGAPQK